MCHDIVCGTSSREAAADSLDISDSDRQSFYTGLTEIEAEYERLAELLTHHKEILFVSHVPPFNTPFDRHHAVGTREIDREYLHVGSIALKLAIRDHDVFAALSGHSHVHDYDIGTGSDGRPHYLNLGYRGIGTVVVAPSRGQFEVVSLTTEGDQG